LSEGKILKFLFLGVFEVFEVLNMNELHEQDEVEEKKEEDEQRKKLVMVHHLLRYIFKIRWFIFLTKIIKLLIFGVKN
jgi:hypothetical protein